MEEKKKRKQLEYLKKLQDKVLAEDATLIASTKNSQIVGAKYKEVVNIFLEDKIELQLSKKTKEKQLRKYYDIIRQVCGQTLARVRVSWTQIDRQYYYQSTKDGEHMIWKSCNIGESSLEWSERTQGLEELGRVQKELGLGMMSRDNDSSWCIHGVHMMTEIKRV